MIKSKRNGVEANILTSQDVGGGSKLLNNPEIGEWESYTTEEWGELKVLKKIEKPGLYYLGVDFTSDGMSGGGVEARYDVNAHSHDMHAEGRLDGTLFSASLGSIYNFPKDFTIKACIYTKTPGIKYKMRYVLVCLRDDSDSQDA